MPRDIKSLAHDAVIARAGGANGSSLNGLRERTVSGPPEVGGETAGSARDRRINVHTDEEPCSCGIGHVAARLQFLVVIAILLPAVFDLTERAAAPEANISLMDERLSLGVSVVLLLLYAANLIYTLITHRDVFAGDAPSGKAEWSMPRALAVMMAGTGLIALEAELASAALEATSTQLGLSPVFMGVVVLALVGTAADLFAAVVFARQDRMDIVFSMCIGSAIQIALVVAPVLVLASWVIGRPMNLVFGSPLDLFAIAGAAFIVRSVAADGETTWFEGLLLVGVYLLFALAYYFESPV